MNKPAGSVLYVTESPEISEAHIAGAQHFASARDLPFAVVYCLEEVNPEKQVDILGGFRIVETHLKRFNIPLIVLIGQRDKVLPWMGGHVKPVRIFTSTDTVEQGSLQAHPLAWPGRVMTVAELQAMVSGDQTYCLPT